MGFAVNASTMGMAVAGLARRPCSASVSIADLGSWSVLALLSIPTALLAVAPDLTTFTVLRVTQGLCMASAFTLTLAYLGEECSATGRRRRFAAYITGNVASNLIGRLDLGRHSPTTWASPPISTFLRRSISRAQCWSTLPWLAPLRWSRPEPARPSPFAAWFEHLRNPQLRAAFGIGFLHPVRVHRHVHLSSTSFWSVRRCRSARWSSASSISCSCPRSSRRFWPVALFIDAERDRHCGVRWRWPVSACRCFCCPILRRSCWAWSSSASGRSFAQATATGFVSRAATADRGSASGIYLACYFAGGLVGTADPRSNLRPDRMAGLRRRELRCRSPPPRFSLFA